jgi:hypothetical protein
VLTYEFWKITVGVLCTIGLYSVLYKETKFYRFFEHMFLGLAVGFSVVALWKETLYVMWWQKMTGTPAEGGDPAIPGYWVYMLLLPVGLLGYTVFSRKHNWMSRIPIGIILGMWSGQQIMNWWRTFGPQIRGSMQPVMPTTWESFIKPSTFDLNTTFTPPRFVPNPAKVAEVGNNIYLSQAISNFIFVFTVVCALSYFIFSFELKGKVMHGINTAGRWLLMIGFGAIFGSTVMARFALVIDRMAFIYIEWIQTHLVPLFGGGGGPPAG